MRSIWWCVAGLATISAPTQAHWQWSKWGMTPAQVVAASSGTAQSGAGEKSAQGDTTRDAVGTYQAGSFEFKTNFWFDQSGLKRVALSLRDDAKCLELQRDLLAK